MFSGLAEVGISKFAISIYEFDCPGGGCASPCEGNAAVIQHQRAGVAHVIPMTGGGSFKPYSEAAQRQERLRGRQPVQRVADAHRRGEPPALTRPNLAAGLAAERQIPMAFPAQDAVFGSGRDRQRLLLADPVQQGLQLLEGAGPHLEAELPVICRLGLVPGDDARRQSMTAGASRRFS